MQESPELDPVRFSHLKRFSDSALHYAHALTEEEDKEAYQFGRLTHYLTLGVGLGGAENDFVIWNEMDAEGKLKPRRGKLWDAFKAEHDGREIFTQTDYDKALLIANAVKKDKVAGPLLEGIPERKIDWMLNGRKCRSHLDLHNPKARRLVDLKTTTSAHPDRFPWEIRRYDYHAQMSFYQDALAYIEQPVDEVILIAVEKTAPYAVTCFELTPALLLEGRKKCRLWFEKLLGCEKAKFWPGYAQGIVTVDVAPTIEPLMLTMADGSEMAAA